ncbi:MAG: LuxR C-terminal-related transcriptional regulator [Chloroflexota bacterium]
MDPTVDSADQLLRTKLYCPPVPKDMLVRSRLLEQMDSYLSQQVILVHAPAGYGKSTLVSQWFEHLDYPVAWVSLDEYDRDPRTFVAYLLAAVNDVFPEIGESTHDLLASPPNIPFKVMADALIGDLEDLSSPLFLALDDFHEVRGSDAESIVERLIKYMPPNLHLVLVCRARPQLPLSRLKLQQQMGEISTDDLRLQKGEARELITRLAGHRVDAGTIELLESRTEGWVVGLYLAGLSLRGNGDLDLNRLMDARDSNLVFNYLIEEVTGLIPSDLHDFLIRTSILDRFSPELCSAILPQIVSSEDALATLRRIETANLFLIPLDNRHGWYRYHHLFRHTLNRFLEAEVSSEEIALLHERASHWFESSGMISDAIRHAVAAGDDIGAAQIAENHYSEALNVEDWNRIVNWLELLPMSVMDRPAVLMMQAWVYHFSWRTGTAAKTAQLAKDGLADCDLDSARISRLRAEADVFNAEALFTDGDLRLAEFASSALTNLPPNMIFAQGLAEFYTAVGFQQAGRVEEGVAFLKERLALNGHQPDSRIFRLLLGLCAVHLFEGDLQALESSVKNYYDISLQAGNQLSLAWAMMVLGTLVYERNDLPAAEIWFSKLVQLRNLANVKAVVDGFIGLVLTLMDGGRLDDAEDILNRFRVFLVETGSLSFMSFVESLEARMSLARRRTQPGNNGAVYTYKPAQRIPIKLSFLEIPLVTAARTLIAEGSLESLEKARDYLYVVCGEVNKIHEARRLVEVNALLSVVLSGLGDDSGALDALSVALEQGEPGGYVRSIVNAGPKLVPLLAKLRDRGEHVVYITHLLQALDDPTVVGGSALEILLTNREMEVLERLALRQSNKEIATELYLSPLTVKRHTQSLFRKLGASSRREAVVIARHKGLSI